MGSDLSQVLGSYKHTLFNALLSRRIEHSAYEVEDFMYGEVASKSNIVRCKLFLEPGVEFGPMVHGHCCWSVSGTDVIDNVLGCHFCS